MRSSAVASVLLAGLAFSAFAQEEPLPLPAKELLKLNGKEFIEAAKNARSHVSQDSVYSEKDLINITGKLAETAASLPHSENPPYIPLDDFFKAACQRATGTQVDQLMKIYATLDTSERVGGFDLDLVADPFIRRELRRLNGKRPVFTKPNEPLPDRLVDAPKDLIDAWRLYKTVTQSFAETVPAIKPNEEVDFLNNISTFYRAINSTLFDKDPAAGTKQLTRFMTGGDRRQYLVDDTYDLAMLMVFLRDHRLREAAGAAAMATGGSYSWARSFDDSSSPVIETLNALGIDWQAVAAGAVIDMQLGGSRPREGSLVLLTAYGDDRGANLVNQLARWVNPGSGWMYVGALEEFLPEREPDPDEEPDLIIGIPVVSDGVNFYRFSKAKVSEKLQLQALSFIEAFDDSDALGITALFRLRAFDKMRSRTSIPPLRRMLQTGSADIAEKAARVLQALGEPPESLGLPKPVVIHLLVNGNDLPPETQIAWFAEKENDGGMGTTSTINAAGDLELERTHFVDPKHKLTSIEVATTGEGVNPDQPLFRAHIPAPTNLDENHCVDIPAHPVTFRFQNLQRSSNRLGATCRITFALPPPAGPSIPALEGPTLPSVEAPLESVVVLPEVADGTYSVSVAVSGAEKWSSQLVVDENGAEASVPLRAGSNVHFSAYQPNGEPTPGSLIKDGTPLNLEVDYRTKSFQNLPIGNYVLHLLNSEEARAKSGLTTSPGPEEIPFAAKDVAFIVSENSPATIELGEIHLEAAKH